MDSFPSLSWTLCGIWLQTLPYWDLLFLRIACSWTSFRNRNSHSQSSLLAPLTLCLYMLMFKGHLFSYWSKYKPMMGIQSAQKQSHLFQHHPHRNDGNLHFQFLTSFLISGTTFLTTYLMSPARGPQTPHSICIKLKSSSFLTNWLFLWVSSESVNGTTLCLLSTQNLAVPIDASLSFTP